MKLVKKTAEYSIFQRGDERYAVKDAAKNSVNGEEKVRILLAEGLITVSAAAPAEVEAPATDAGDEGQEAEAETEPDSEAE